MAAQAESLCSVGPVREVGVQRSSYRNVRLNPHPSHETKARRMGPACGRQAPEKSNSSVEVMWKGAAPAPANITLSTFRHFGNHPPIVL